MGLMSRMSAFAEKVYINCSNTIPRPDPERDVLVIVPDAGDAGGGVAGGASAGQAASGGAGCDHSQWDTLLRTHVSSTEIDGIITNGVDYVGMAASPAFDAYLATLSATDPAKLAPNEQLALYLNAYNALCIGLVVQAYRKDGTLPGSINELGEGKVPVWDREAGQIGGDGVTLNGIEHNILRTKWRDPRIHACIVCASTSCPDLRPEAFVPHRLNAQMDDNVQRWLAHPKKGVAMGGGSHTRPVVSRIFLWFREDFEAVTSSVSAWIADRLESTTATTTLGGGGAAAASACTTGGSFDRSASLDYFSYKWSLNNKSP